MQFTVVFSGLLLLGTSLGNMQYSFSEREICNGPKCNDSPNAIDNGGKPGKSPKASPSPAPTASPGKEKSINCELLLKQNTVNCSGLSAKTCDLVTWMYAGCKKQAKCAGATGVNAKKCCDDADRLPFGAGVYYTGYMRACAPQYRLKRFDRPDFIDRPCSADYGCGDGMGKGLCDMRSWENAGCQQRATCDAKIKSVSELPQCCKEWPAKPEGLFKQLYQSRFDLKCLRK
ncbi:hypothetical protein QQS21_012621 [Conoideocrella luteorostrata]|uniref:Uncharacterized protein n=1 Tax=Conoideocrella luteorostrata TaxID=1105319 RepID=A0AAJ0CB52_9HYPO|nr:hypothetical protein QQS21_012621 [Conoideocrella luteorostrata]